MVERPDATPGAPVDAVACNRPKDARVLRAVAVVAHHEVLIGAHHLAVGMVGRPLGIGLPVFGQVWLVEPVAVYVNDSSANQNALARKGDDALDEVFGIVRRWTKNDDVAPLRVVQPVVDL